MSGLRRAVPDDAAVLTDLRAIMLDRMAEGATATGDAGWHAATTSWFAERLADTDACAVFVVDDPATVACAMGVVSATAAPVPGLGRVPTGEVFNVVTRAESRGRGHARTCVTAVLEWMDTAGVARVSLAATPDGEPLYRALGFTARPWRAMWRHAPPGPRGGEP